MIVPRKERSYPFGRLPNHASNNYIDSTPTRTDGAMMNILQINSSARREASNSTRLAARLAQRLREADPTASVTVRDLNATPHPVLDEAALGALFAPAGERTPEQAARVALDDVLITEIQAADSV